MTQTDFKKMLYVLQLICHTVNTSTGQINNLKMVLNKKGGRLQFTLLGKLICIPNFFTINSRVSDKFYSNVNVDFMEAQEVNSGTTKVIRIHPLGSVHNLMELNSD